MENEATIKVNLGVEQAKEEPKFKEWEIRDAVRTLTEAEKIRQNTELMALVLPELEKNKKAAENAYANILYGGKENKADVKNG